MDTMSAFARGQANKGKECMVFDWDKAARLIVEHKPTIASAGLRNDWEWTGGVIFENETPTTEYYTYLESNWATPELDLDGHIYPCFVMSGEATNPNRWNENTKWPPSALTILKGENNENSNR